MGLREGALGPGQLIAGGPTPAPAPARPRRSSAGAEEMARQAVEAERRLDDLQERLGFQFKRRELLRESMTHTSWINERGDQGRDNERLEYLGDAVLELVAGEYLFSRFPNYDEGQLTQMRSSLVSTVALARLGEQLLLGETLRLGRGAAKSGARRLTSLHANAFEALVGAIFLDQGYRRAGKVFLSRIGDLSAWTDPNFKGRLQALAQEHYGAPPQYKTATAAGDPRSRVYVSQVSVEGHGQLGEGRGGTKQAAEQAAARAAIDIMVAPVSKKRRRRAVPVAKAASPAAIWVAPEPTSGLAAEPELAPSHDAGLGPAPAAPSLSAPVEVGAPSAASGDAQAAAGEAAPSKRRRRRPTRSRSAVVEAAPIPMEPASPPAGPTPAAAEVVPAKRRRRRPTRSRSAVAEAAAVQVEAAAPPAGPSPVGGDEFPAKRRRRRSSRSRSGGADTSALPTESGAPLVTQTLAVGEAGPAQRRRRRSPGGRIVDASMTAPPDQTAEMESKVAVGEESADGSARRRTHRGRRSGRRRAGGTVTPAP
ncbi:MAG: ribonuclease III [Candidatus Dormibacteria bacterium]